MQYRRMQWDDLRYVLEVTRTGSALGAAKGLGVNQTTVIRRIAALEARLGARLFERHSGGYEATPFGREAAAVAGRMELEALALAAFVAAGHRALSGSVRLSAAETLANLLVAPCLQAFQKAHPGIRVELDASDRRADVARGEADVALRAGSRPEGAGIVARRLPDNDWAVYCSRAYADENGSPSGPDAIAGHAVVALDGRMGQVPASQWLVSRTTDAEVRVRSNSLTNLVSNLRAGLGLGALPCILGDGEPELVRCFPPPLELRSEMWLIVRAELKSAPHVRALTDFLAAHVISQRPRLAPSA
jgi:DNA-binding transcriptional LysR family regulator